MNRRGSSRRVNKSKEHLRSRLVYHVHCERSLSEEDDKVRGHVPGTCTELIRATAYINILAWAQIAKYKRRLQSKARRNVRPKRPILSPDPGFYTPGLKHSLGTPGPNRRPLHGPHGKAHLADIIVYRVQASEVTQTPFGHRSWVG